MSVHHVVLTRPIPHVNALRRSILSMIPHAAVDSVQVEVNTTVHNDSFLSKTLEMLPIMDAPALALDMVLDVTSEHELMTVDSSMITVIAGDPTWVKPGVFLFHLQRGQRVRLRAKSSRGTPREHVRYQVAHAGYRIVPTITVPAEVDRDALAALCCRNVFDQGIAADRCIACGDCAALGVTVTPTDTVHFFIDSFAEPALQIYQWGLRALMQQASIVLRATPVWVDDGVVPDTRVWLTDAIHMTVAQVLVFEMSKLGAAFHAVRQLHPLQPMLAIRVSHPDPTGVLVEAATCALEQWQGWLEGI